MLDYVITQNQKHGLSRRTLICLTASFLAHFFFFFILIEFPQLLETGYYHQFRGFQRSIKEDDDSNWRTVAVLESPKKMALPSPELLKKLLAPEKKGDGAPPVKVNLGDVAAAISKLSALTQNKKAQAPVPPLAPAAPAADLPAIKTAPPNQTAAQSSASKEASEKGAGLPLLSPKSGGQPEIAVNSAPAKIPDAIKPPASSQNQKTIQSSGVELSDTEGFPMGDYQNIITDRIYANWFIPSNMKNSQGRTTIMFNIDTEGRCTNIRIARSSGYKSLDLAAQSAIINSDPFPPLPKGFPGDRISVKFHMIVKP